MINVNPRVKSAYNDLKVVGSFLLNPSKAMKKGSVVNLGWKHNTGNELVEAQLPESVVKATPTVAKGLAYLMMVTIPVGTIKAITDEISTHAKSKANVVMNIANAKETALLEDSLVFDTQIPLPYKLYNVTKNASTPAGRFFKSIKDNKDSLMSDLNISSEEYNEYAILALKLCKEESQYGQSKSYKAYNTIEQYEVGRDLVSAARKSLKGDGVLSLGMTRYKIDNAPKEEKVLFDKYGISYDSNSSNIIEPEKSAIATIIHLATMGKDYDKYVKNATKLKPNITDPTVQTSIRNAQSILFDDVRRPKAVLLLQGGQKAVDESMVDGGIIPIKVSDQDLDDLRTYASTIILSKEAYLAGRWNGRKVLPEGRKKDQACANLLNVAAQKGYISNINKKSKVIY